MRRWMLLLLVVSLFFADYVDATPPDNQNIADPRKERLKPPPLPLQVQSATQKALPFDRVMYILDVSGSMQDALGQAIRVSGVFGSDDIRVAVVTFADAHTRWKGVKESCDTKHTKVEPHGRHCLEPGWCFMPKHYDKLMDYLETLEASGGTDPTSAILHAVKNAPDGTLIVFVSDGGFSLDNMMVGGIMVGGPVTAFHHAQAWRKKNKKAPIQMLVWATSEEDAKNKSLITLAKVGGAGLWRAHNQRSGPW